MLAVESEVGERDLHDQRGPLRMRVPIVSRIAGDDRDVGLGLGLIVECHRRLLSHIPAWPKGRDQSALGTLSTTNRLRQRLRNQTIGQRERGKLTPVRASSFSPISCT